VRFAEASFTAKIGTVEYQLGVLEYDLGTFQSHSGTLDYHFSQVAAGIKSVREGQAAVRNCWQQLQQAVQANSSGSGGAEFVESDMARFGWPLETRAPTNCVQPRDL